MAKDVRSDLVLLRSFQFPCLEEEVLSSVLEDEEGGEPLKLLWDMNGDDRQPLQLPPTSLPSNTHCPTVPLGFPVLVSEGQVLLEPPRGGTPVMLARIGGKTRFYLPSFGIYGVHIAKRNGDGSVHVSHMRIFSTSPLHEFVKAVHRFEDVDAWLWRPKGTSVGDPAWYGSWSEELQTAVVEAMEVASTLSEKMTSMLGPLAAAAGMGDEVDQIKRLEWYFETILEKQDPTAMGHLLIALQEMLLLESFVGSFSGAQAGSKGLKDVIEDLQKEKFLSLSPQAQKEVSLAMEGLLQAGDSLCSLPKVKESNLGLAWWSTARPLIIQQLEEKVVYKQSSVLKAIRKASKEKGGLMDLLSQTPPSQNGGPLHSELPFFDMTPSENCAPLCFQESLDGVPKYMVSFDLPLVLQQEKLLDNEVDKLAEGLVGEAVIIQQGGMPFKVGADVVLGENLLRKLLYTGLAYAGSGGGDGRICALLGHQWALLELQDTVYRKKRHEKAKDCCRLLRQLKKEDSWLELKLSSAPDLPLKKICEEKGSDTWVGPSLCKVWRGMVDRGDFVIVELWLHKPKSKTHGKEVKEKDNFEVEEENVHEKSLVAADFCHLTGSAVYVATRWFSREARKYQPGFMLALAELDMFKEMGFKSGKGEILFRVWDLGGASLSPMMHYKKILCPEVSRAEAIQVLRKCRDQKIDVEKQKLKVSGEPFKISEKILLRFGEVGKPEVEAPSKEKKRKKGETAGKLS